MMVVSKDNADHYKWGTDCDGWHFAKTANLSVIQESVPPGAGEVKHYHEKAEQFFFILTGTATIEVDGCVYQVSDQQGISIPAGAIHELRNEAKSDLIFLVVSTPPSHGNRVIVG